MTPKLRLRILRIAKVFAGFVLILCSAGIAESYYERFEAQKLIACLSEIQVGTTTEVRAKEITRRFSRYGTLGNYPKDAHTELFDQFEFQNRALSFLHLSPATWIWITIQYKRGLVVQKHAQAASEPRCSGSVTESVHNESVSVERPVGRGRTVGIGGETPSGYFVIQVRDDLSTPLIRRQMDWQIDLSCMTWRAGCADPRKTLHGVFVPVTDQAESQ